MSNQLLNKKDDVSIVVCGEAGQGMDTVAHILSKIFKLYNYNIFSTKEYMSRIRGGSNSTEIRVASHKVYSYLRRIDVLISLSKGAIDHVTDRLSAETIIIGEQEHLDEKYKESCKLIEVPFTGIAKEIGHKLFSNIVAAGVIVGLFKIKPDVLYNYVKDAFAHKGEDIVNKNTEAAKRGYEIGTKLIETENIHIDIAQDPSIKEHIIFGGTNGIALGCLLGGCNFIAAYPMSPSTGVFTFLAEHQKDFNLIAEQAEDEIAAMNMAIGAWYAGARAMVSTAGGGFALMVEALSLAGMIESPMVIHLAQRPGPATGLPTRTEQGDLELALYAGHGDFPRIILAPGNAEDSIYLSHKAFNFADKYQIPVFILSDQYLVDTNYNILPIDVSNLDIESYVIETDENYKRFALTENGITPRGIPGHGAGLVCVDSDEHDETGHITEDMTVRRNMVDKRFYKKLEEVKKDIIPPELTGNQEYKILIIGWGSTCNVIKEALCELNDDRIAFLYYKQVYPLHPSTADYINKAEKVISIEQNAGGQFANIIKLYTGIEIKHRIHKYDGIQFYLEEVVEQLKKIIEV